MNRTALITGASRGIGRGIALELAGLGWDLVLNYARNDEAARGTATECEKRAKAHGREITVRTCKADIGTKSGRDTLVRFAREAFANLDLLVNNAGVAPETRCDLLDVTEQSLDRLLGVNLKGPFFITQAVAKWMIETESASPRAIVTISSISADTASINRGDYCISKAALSMLTPLFAARLAEHGINVYEIRPGIIATDMTAGVKGKYDELIEEGLTPIRRWGQPADVAMAVSAIAQGLLPFSTGEVLHVDGGFHIRRL